MTYLKQYLGSYLGPYGSFQKESGAAIQTPIEGFFYQDTQETDPHFMETAI